MRIRSDRSGFAMMLVLVFITLFLVMLGVACRRTATALRLEEVRAKQALRDEGSLHALARGVALLETGLPPSDPYICAVDIETSQGTRNYTVTFIDEGEGNWAVNSAPTAEGLSLTVMPAVFLPPDP